VVKQIEMPLHSILRAARDLAVSSAQRLEVKAWYYPRCYDNEWPHFSLRAGEHRLGAC
jgi:hypothetical protein